MNYIKEIFGGNVRQFGMIFALIALMIFFQVASGDKVFTAFNMQNLINGNSYVLILAIGMVLVIIAGHIDLSVGSVAAFVGIVVAITTRDWGLPWYLGVLIGLLVGALVGAWQGFWVAIVGIPAFIVTLAGMLLFRGLNQLVGNSQSIPMPEQFNFLGGGFLPEIGPNTGYNNLTLLLGAICIVALIWSEARSRKSSTELGAAVPPLWIPIVRIILVSIVIVFATLLFASGSPGTSFPIPGIILAVLVLIYGFLSTRTIIGRHVYAVGGNKNAAELSGVKSRRVNFLVMMNMSILAAVAAIVFISRARSSGPSDGTGWELDAIAAVFIGGAAVSGGVGTVMGSMIGGLVMAMLNNGLQLMSVGANWTSVIKGLVLLIAVAIDVYNKSQGRTSIIGMMMKNFSRNEKSGLQKNT